MHKNIICGIYTITNEIDNKIYVGYAINIFQRWNIHSRKLRLGIHDNEHLQRAYDKYGKDNFKFEILEECSADILASQEHYWCYWLNSHNKNYGYNIKPTHPYDEKRCSDETRLKMSKSFLE